MALGSLLVAVLVDAVGLVRAGVHRRHSGRDGPASLRSQAPGRRRAAAT
jgi:hypothetical protein